MDEPMKRKPFKLMLRRMNESADLKESTIVNEILLSKNDANLKALLEVLYLDEDRASSFERYCASKEFKTLLDEILRQAKSDYNIKICEIGAGNGFFAVALAKSGFRNLSILEPNNGWITGTGFIEKTANTHGVRIWNSLDDWYNSDELYDLIITKACVHHFENICKVGTEIRCKISANGKWLMFEEWIANSAGELYYLLANHPHTAKYGQYEWPYSASIYVQLMQMAGFKLTEVIPNKYKNNYMVRNASYKFKFALPFTIATECLRYLGLTVFAFYIENVFVRIFGFKSNYGLFSTPQLMVFCLKNIEFPKVPESYDLLYTE